MGKDGGGFGAVKDFPSSVFSQGRLQVSIRSGKGGGAGMLPMGMCGVGGTGSSSPRALELRCRLELTLNGVSGCLRGSHGLLAQRMR